MSIIFCDQSSLAILNYVDVGTLAFYIGEQRDIAQGLRKVVTWESVSSVTFRKSRYMCNVT